MKRALLFCLLLSLPAHAEDRAAILSRVQGYLNSLTTVQSDFTQIAPDGSLEEGKFYLQRPGKMRWQYNPPVPVLMISNGTTLTYHDTELGQVSNVALDDTLAGFLARKTISFDPAVIKVLEASEQDHVIHVRLTQASKLDEGELTLELSDQPMMLRNMTIKDAGGQVTHVSLNNAVFGQALDPALFIFRDPRVYHPPR